VIGRKENIMRTEQAQAKRGPKDVLLGALGSLALVAGALLSMGGAPATQATSFVEVGKPEAAEPVSSTPDRVSPGGANAERNTLDLQLD
jgi:hypothetical protein